MPQEIYRDFIVNKCAWMSPPDLLYSERRSFSKGASFNRIEYENIYVFGINQQHSFHLGRTCLKFKQPFSSCQHISHHFLYSSFKFGTIFQLIYSLQFAKGRGLLIYCVLLCSRDDILILCLNQQSIHFPYKELIMMFTKNKKQLYMIGLLM